LRRTVSDDVVRAVAASVAGQLGGKTGIAPRVFLRKLVQLLDKVDEHTEFDPLRDDGLKLEASALNDTERQAAGLAPSLDDIDLDAPSTRDSDL
jgi:hypothetical protein